MDVVWAYIGKAAASLGGITVVIWGISRWVGKIVENRLISDWKRKNDAELENIRASLQRNQSISNAAIANLSSGHQAANERRLKGVEIIWNSILDIRNLCHSAIFFYSILLPDEYNTVFDKPTFKAMIADLDMDKIAKMVNEVHLVTETHRPFVGEEVWALFVGYKIFLTRMANLIATKVQEASIVHWLEDKPMMDLIKNIFSEKEIQLLHSQPIIWVTGNTVAMFERKLIEKMSKVISGELSATTGYELSKRIIESANRLETSKGLKDD